MAFVPIYILILAFTIIIDYIAGILIEKAAGTKRKLYLIISLIANIGVLVVFKYYNFFAASFADFLSNFGFQVNVGTLEIILPVGYENYQDQVKNLKVPILLFAGSKLLSMINKSPFSIPAFLSESPLTLP